MYERYVIIKYNMEPRDIKALSVGWKNGQKGKKFGTERHYNLIISEFHLQQVLL